MALRKKIAYVVGTFVAENRRDKNHKRYQLLILNLIGEYFALNGNYFVFLHHEKERHRTFKQHQFHTAGR